MSKKMQEFNPLQGSMFDQEALLIGDNFANMEISASRISVLNESVPAPQSAKQAEYPTVYGKEGSYVDVAERAEHLREALGAFGLRNQRLGFGYASNTNRLSGPIWGAYKSRTPIVQEGAEANSEKFLLEAKRAFWSATGLAAMRGKGFGDNAQIDQEGKKLWREFAADYEHTSKRPQRDKYTKQLGKAAKQARKFKSAAA
ncbi:MAG: hypothetical protein JWO35_206 [Candidatus Saccharibacteria bacterium]|nr:hypothetical protein [Candidatus Saccharibacteria bacterium]